MSEVIAQLEEERTTAEDLIADLNKQVTRWKKAADWGVGGKEGGASEQITTKVQIEVCHER